MSCIFTNGRGIENGYEYPYGGDFLPKPDSWGQPLNVRSGYWYPSPHRVISLIVYVRALRND